MKNFSKRITYVLPKQDWIVVGWCISIKILLFVLAAKSFPAPWDKRQTWMVNVLKIGSHTRSLERS